MDIAANFSSIRRRMEIACERVGRDPGAVALLAVTKGQPPETVRAAAAQGQVLFGENKIQEAKAKIPLCPGRLHWHMIGHLQSNKCRDAVHLFGMIESVDSLTLAQEIDKWAEKQAKRIAVLLQVNVAEESSKFGYRPGNLLAELDQLNRLPRLEIQGLMTVPPYVTNPEKARRHFQQLRALKQQAEEKLGAPLAHLSMGMSGDFEVAIEEGATIVRLGTSLFGPRRTSASLAREEDGP